jgi:DNA gyrase subunit A
LSGRTAAYTPSPPSAEQPRKLGSGKAIRFPVDDVREFVSRTSTGVRGMLLSSGDEVISMSILKAFAATPQEREDYLKAAAWKSEPGERILSETRMAQFAVGEEFILTVTANGFGKRSSAFEYRQSGRGGQGIRNIGESERNGDVVASFTAKDGDQLMLVTDQAKLIRTMVGQVGIKGRSTLGVTLFDVADGEHVVSAALIAAEDEGEDTAVGLPESDVSGD